ncbi:ABC transporter permease [Chitinophagaceae bacterium MMS25-I14]
MKKVYATIWKEWLLLRRDIAGLGLLLLMPAVLIVVMAMVQDAPFRDYQEIRFDLLMADNDGGSLAKEIKNGLRQSKNFNVIDSIGGREVSEQQLKSLLGRGDYKVGIVIPKGATSEIANSANLIANNISEKLGLGTLPARSSRDSMYVRMYFDPVTKPTFRMSISFALDKYVTYSCSNVLVQRLSRLSKTAGDTSAAQAGDFKKVFQGIGIKEEKLGGQGFNNVVINSVQHNVPAWAIFGMFFIVVTISGQMIREREEGSAVRIMLIPGSLKPVAWGKIFFYIIICTVQFLLMLGIGLWILPLLGLPKLYLGMHPWVILPVTVCIAFAATSYGYFVGTVFKTTNQALPFGAISVVILSALGGIWVPVDILPPMMQRMAMFSPLHWGLDAVNQLLLRNLGITSVLKHMAALVLFGLVLWTISTYQNNRRINSLQ